MFSGIIEAQAPIVLIEDLDRACRIQIQRPAFFDDLKIGDSIAVNGVCLTLEAMNPEQMTFTLGAETLRVLNWDQSPWTLRPANLERSLRLGDRIHGHLVSGHVDELGQVTRSAKEGESWVLDIALSPERRSFVWPKGSITIQGVSLTVNQIKDGILSVCLIPETLKRTHLGTLKVNDFVNLEFDWMAKALIQTFQQQIKEMRLP